ncbi:MAG: hypothetical protein SPG85_06420, partial [Collinsella sp.]|nr:hypothetical protein [Collinsella sp.]
MNRKLNAAITAGLSLSMVLGSTPVTAIAAQVQQPAAKSATEANVEKHTVTYYDEGYDPIDHFEGYDGTTAWLQRTPAPKDGKVFVGWKFVGDDDSNIIPAGTELKADLNVQAVWKDAVKETHTVTYY